MASNFFSRLTGSGNPSASIYETLRQHDQDSDLSDVDERAGVAANGTVVTDRYRDVDLSDAHPTTNPHRHAGQGHATVGSPGLGARRDAARTGPRPRWTQRHRLLDVEEADDEVPASLLIDHNVGAQDPTSLNLPPPPSHYPDEPTSQRPTAPSPGRCGAINARHRPPAEPGRIPRPTNAYWATAWGDLASADPKEKAMFRWVNVEDLDNFLLEVYTYYLYNGFWSIVLMRIFNLVTVAFVVGFSLFLTQCIDYRLIRGSHRLSQAMIPQCASKMGFIPNALLWVTTFIWLWKTVVYVFDVPRLRRMHNFYRYLLDVPEAEIQSISWQEIVRRLMALRDANPTITSTSKKSGAYIRTQNKQRMDAHDIANRLMRRQNYMIAMINKDVLDLTLPIPFLRNRTLFTRTLEWNIDLCIMDFVFNQKGQLRPLFLRETHRKGLSDALRQRFLFAGAASLVFAPFLAVFFILKHFFQNFNEYQKNPAQIGTREYSRFAQWKFREFNELYHLFQRRINMSYPFADRYINQFPKDKTVQAAQLVSLVSGAVVSVLGLATILDQENFLNFEITPGRTTIFYLGIFGSIWAVARGLLPDDNLVYDTAYSIQEVIEFTHYEPEHWKSRLHSVEVKQEFTHLYQMKLVIFLEEVLSMIFTPFVLWFSLPKCSDRIIDFFREFTVHVDGIGYVCTFAEFNFMKQTNRPADEPPGPAPTTGPGQGIATRNLRDDYFAAKDNKLEQSYWGFMNDYARNPKTDIRFPYSGARRRWNMVMPPPVPGLPSPTIPASEFGHSVGGGLFAHRPGANLGPLASPFRGGLGTPRFTAQPLGAGAGQLPPQPLGSPLQSLLLDPHHQPSASGFASSPHAGRSRGGPLVKQRRTSDREREIPDEVAEEDPSSPELRPHRAHSGMAGLVGAAKADLSSHEGELGSWKYEVESSSAGTSDDEEDEADAKAVTALGPLGPLGLIQQFQKAQTQEGGRTRSGAAGI